jgi:hypothetical protein
VADDEEDEEDDEDSEVAVDETVQA